MNLVAKIRSLQAQVDELRARLDALSAPIVLPEPVGASSGGSYTMYGPTVTVVGGTLNEPLTQPIDATPPIASVTIAPPPARRRGRPPKPKV